MNIEVLYDSILLFERESVESGFFRDLNDYLASLPNNQSNIVSLREMAENTLNTLKNIYSGELPKDLELLFPQKKIQPFTGTDYDQQLLKLLENKEIKVTGFYTELNKIFNQLRESIQTNMTEVSRLKEVFDPYVNKEIEEIVDQERAIVSLLFNDLETVSKLNQFSETLKKWNRNLLLYHQVLKSTSPDDIKVVAVQNGSIDVILNIDLDIAINLVEIFKIGFKCYLAYLSYKKLAKPLIDTYFGNKKLEAQEKERQKEMLNNIGIAVTKKINDQHKNAKKIDSKIDSNIDKKVEQISKQVTSHIVKGNEFKIRALPEPTSEATDAESENEREYPDKNELIKLSTDVKNRLAELPTEEQKKLLEIYGDEKIEKGDENESKQT